jgi:hypothetical protein
LKKRYWSDDSETLFRKTNQSTRVKNTLLLYGRGQSSEKFFSFGISAETYTIQIGHRSLCVRTILIKTTRFYYFTSVVRFLVLNWMIWPPFLFRIVMYIFRSLIDPKLAGFLFLTTKFDLRAKLNICCVISFLANYSFPTCTFRAFAVLLPVLHEYSGRNVRLTQKLSCCCSCNLFSGGQNLPIYNNERRGRKRRGEEIILIISGMIISSFLN